jgi:hypothetical protein
MDSAAEKALARCAAPAREKARSQKVPGTGKRTARPAGKPGSSSALVRLRRFLLHPLPCRESKPEDLSMRFLRHAESISPMWGVNPSLGWSNDLPPVNSSPSPRTRREERVLLIVLMSSDRLFLDRVARQHCPSPLHRHGQTTTGLLKATRNRTFLLCQEADISTLP